jgi:2'-5' RNA ligase
MKLFVGVTPRGLKANGQLKQIYSKLKRTIGDWEEPVRWTPPDMWHVTVLFLGERSEEEVQRAEKLLDRWHPPAAQQLELSFHGLGAFPSSDHGRVLFVGVRENKAFFTLQDSLEQAFVDGGLITEPEKDFTPHLTLVRFRHTRHLQSLIDLGAKTKFGTEPLEELILFESVSENHIPKYIPRYVKKLSGSGLAQPTRTTEY